MEVKSGDTRSTTHKVWLHRTNTLRKAVLAATAPKDCGGKGVGGRSRSALQVGLVAPKASLWLPLTQATSTYRLESQMLITLD